MTNIIFLVGFHHLSAGVPPILLCTMISQHFRDVKFKDLSHITTYLEEQFYREIELTCSTALNYISQVMELDLHGSMVLNAVLCEQLIDEVMDIVRVKKSNLQSYLLQLSEKQQGGHDCRGCSGNCNMEHSIQLMNLKGYNDKIERIIHRLQTEGTPLNNIEYSSLYSIVRQQMNNLEKQLVDLSFFEQTNLIPAVISAQQHIHVHP